MDFIGISWIPSNMRGGSLSQSNDQKHLKKKGMLKAVQGQSKYLLDLFLRCY